MLLIIHYVYFLVMKREISLTVNFRCHYANRGKKRMTTEFTQFPFNHGSRDTDQTIVSMLF